MTANVSICVRAGLPKLRPVPETKRWTKITLIAYTEPHHCANILLVAAWLLLTSFVPCILSPVSYTNLFNSVVR